MNINISKKKLKVLPFLQITWFFNIRANNKTAQICFMGFLTSEQITWVFFTQLNDQNMFYATRGEIMDKFKK